MERVSPTDSSLKVTITPPSSTYEEFTVTYGRTDGSEMTSMMSDVSSPTTITGLNPYTQYTFNVTTLFMEFPSTVVSATEYTGTLLMLDMKCNILKDPGRSKYNHTSMESLVDVEYKYILRVNIVFPFHKLQDAERTSHCPPPPSYVTYLVRLAETLMTSFRVGVET